jgi:DNA polymerase-3 subunit beta
MKNFPIPVHILRASIPCCAIADIRAVLNGVNVTWSKDERVLRVISTTGALASLFSCKIPTQESDSFELTIPLESIKLALAAKATKGLVAHLSLSDAGEYDIDARIKFIPCEGKFPDFRRIIPLTLSGETGEFDPELLVRANKALREYYRSKKEVYTLTQNGREHAAMHNGESDAIVIVAPICPTIYDKRDKVYCGFN